MSGAPVLDTRGRPLGDLRVSVTDRCNFRCSYCMPKELFGNDYAFLPPDQLLSFDEIERLVGVFASLGVTSDRVSWILGVDCKCKDRQECLNQWGRWARHVIAGHNDTVVK